MFGWKLTISLDHAYRTQGIKQYADRQANVRSEMQSAVEHFSSHKMYQRLLAFCAT